MTNTIDPAQHLGLVGLAIRRYCGHRPGIPIQDREEWSDGCLGLIRGCRAYHPARSPSVSTCLMWYIRGAVTDGQKQRIRFRARQERYMEHHYREPVLSEDWARERAEWLAAAIPRLPATLQHVVESIRDGQTMAQIAAGLGVSEQLVYFRRGAAIKMLQEMLPQKKNSENIHQ